MLVHRCLISKKGHITQLRAMGEIEGYQLYRTL